MGSSGYRINGGIGFGLKDPAIEAIIKPSKGFSFRDNRINSLNKTEIGRLRKVVDRAAEDEKFKFNVTVTVSGNIQTHSGFGTGTLIRLICLEALFILNDRDYDENTLVNLSKRGGTSGIGIRTYFHGGLILDIGHRKGNLIPSSSAERESRNSLLLASCRMPNWKIGICIPHFISPLTGKQEKDFFTKTLPISETSIHKVLYHSIYGLFASIREDDKENFYRAINVIQECEWKKAERKIYGKPLENLEKILRKSGAKCVGMSSLGPTLFFFGDDVSDIIKKAKSDLKNYQCTFLSTKAMNRGRIIEKC